MKESKKEFKGCGLYSVRIAKEIGPTASIFVLHICMRMKKNESNSRFFIDGKIWVMSSLRQISEDIGTSSRKLEGAVKKCIDAGFVEKSTYNEKTLDRSCWYTLTEKAYEYM